MLTRTAASAEANTVTIPTHDVGHLIVIFAFRDGSTTNPTIPAGWTSITNTLDGTTCSASAAWKIAASAGETSGTWTNATVLLCWVGRGVDLPTPIITTNSSTGSSTTLTYNTLAEATTGPCWVIGFAAHRSVDTTTLDTPPTGMGLVQSRLGATSDAAIHDTGHTLGGWPATTAATGGTSSGWITLTVAVREARMQWNNFQHVSSTGLSVTERTR